MTKTGTLQDLSTGDIIYPLTIISQVDGLETRLGTLATTQSVDNKIENLKSEILGDDLVETFNTLKAVQEWANEHGTDYQQLVEDVNSKASQIEVTNINGTLNDVQEDIDDIQSNLSNKVENSVYEAKIRSLEETIQELTTRLTTLESYEYSNIRYVE